MYYACNFISRWIDLRLFDVTFCSVATVCMLGFGFVHCRMASLKEQRVCVKCYVKLGKTAVETRSTLCETYGNETSNKTTLCEWHALPERKAQMAMRFRAELRLRLTILRLSKGRTLTVQLLNSLYGEAEETGIFTGPCHAILKRWSGGYVGSQRRCAKALDWDKESACFALRRRPAKTNVVMDVILVYGFETKLTIVMVESWFALAQESATSAHGNRVLIFLAPVIAAFFIMS
jgi:hypothetical protein